MDHVHWWLAALSFGLGMALTFTSMARPARVQMPPWVLADITAPPRPAPEPPAMKAPAVEEPAKEQPVTMSRPVQRKTVSKGLPRKRRPISKDAPTQRIPVTGDAVTERIPVAKDAATERIPVPKKRPAKKPAGAPAKNLARRPAGTPAKRPRPKGAAKRSPAKDAATKQLPTSDDPPTTVLPLIPYAPYGQGSMRAEPDGRGPDGWEVKGRMDSRLFYAPGDAGYDEVVAQVWFQNEEFAAKAFFTPGRNSARKT